jgi:hypothetical protein
MQNISKRKTDNFLLRNSYSEEENLSVYFKKDFQNIRDSESSENEN